MLLRALRAITIRPLGCGLILRQLRQEPSSLLCAVHSRSYATAHAPPKLTLRPYQEAAIEAVQENLRQGHRRLGISLATGSGKTVIFTHLIERIQPTGKRRQSIVLVHRRELAEQAYAHIKRAHPELDVEIEMGNLNASGAADVTVCSVMTLSAAGGGRLLKFDPERIKLILMDECHHAVAKTWLSVLDYFGALKKKKEPVNAEGEVQDVEVVDAQGLKDTEEVTDGPIVVGVSATMSRFDGQALSTVLDRIVFHKDYMDMVGDKWLSESRFTTVKCEYDLKGVKLDGKDGDFNLASLSATVNTRETNELTVRTWIARAENRKSTLVFCCDIQHGQDMCATFRQHGINAHVVTGKTGLAKRKELLDQFRRGEFPVLINIGVFTEGTDIPNIDCVLLARPTRSKNLLSQMIGRGMRLYPGKEDCHVIDMVGGIIGGVVTTPTLFGLNPDDLVDGKTPTEMQELAEARTVENDTTADTSYAPEGPGIKSVTITDYDSIADLILDMPSSTPLAQLSPNAWVSIGNLRYVLDCSRNGFVRLDSEDGENFTGTFVGTLRPEGGFASLVQHTRPRQLFEGTQKLPEAIRMADTFVTNRFPRHLILRSQEWRRGPPTEAQLNVVAKRLGEDWHKKKRKVTKGEVLDTIVRLKHGFKSLVKKEWAAALKAKKLAEKVAALRAKEEVKVGSLET